MLFLLLFLPRFSILHSLHKIPEKTYEKIEKLLNDRLGYETTNHNAVMGALNPNNEVLLNLVSKDHRELKVLTGETLQHLRMEKAAKENREHILTNAEKEIDKHIESLRAFSRHHGKATRKNCAFRERKYGTQRANSKFKCTAKSAA